MPRVNRELERYFPVAEMIARTFGSNCEVVIHDLSMPQNSVVYTVNNHVTGREIGQPFDHLVKQVLLSSRFERMYAANYPTKDRYGRPIKSSTVLLRGRGDAVIGALCINFGIAGLREMTDELAELLHVEEESAENGVEITPDEHILDIVEQLIDGIVGKNSISEMGRQKRLEMIAFMDQRGLFMVKGAIDQVAARFGVSRVTIYSYLEELRRDSAV